jgi:ribosomal protein L4
VVVSDDDENLALSFRNLQKVAVVAPSELDVAAVVWARSLLVSRAALAGVLARAGSGAGEQTETPEETS